MTKDDIRAIREKLAEANVMRRAWSFYLRYTNLRSAMATKDFKQGRMVLVPFWYFEDVKVPKSESLQFSMDRDRVMVAVR